MEFIGIVLALAAALIVIVTLAKAIVIVPQQREDIVERLGKFKKVLKPGLNLLVPFIDKIRARVDLREQVANFPPQPAITSDNLVVNIDSVLYYVVTEPVRATYEIENFILGVEQLTVTTLRNVIGSMDLERTLTSRDEINAKLAEVLDENTGRWGIKVRRVEIKAIEPPPSIRDAMEKQMRAERDRRATILNAEGVKQSQILTAEGEKQAAILNADGDRQARILQAEGQAKAIRLVVDSIHVADPDNKVMAWQYLQALPQIAAGASNKLWIVPAELTKLLDGIAAKFGDITEKPDAVAAAKASGTALEQEAQEMAAKAAQAAQEIQAAAEAEKRRPGV